MQGGNERKGLGAGKEKKRESRQHEKRVMGWDFFWLKNKIDSGGQALFPGSMVGGKFKMGDEVTFETENWVQRVRGVDRHQIRGNRSDKKRKNSEGQGHRRH